MNRVQRLLQHVLALSLGGLLVASCASSGSSTSERGAAVLVTLRDYKSGARFELASESHTDRVAYYSDARAEAVRKVQSDEAMAAFVEILEDEGLAEHAQSGRAPSVASGGVISWGLEVESGADASHWLVGKGSPAADWQEFQRCRDMFLELYNATISFQTMENADGSGFFDASKKQP